MEAEKKCVYCGADNDLQWEHIDPKALLIIDKRTICDRIQGIHLTDMGM